MADTSGENELLFESSGEIGWITFNRPRARNALTFAMYQRLAEICAEPPVQLRALVLSGAGERAFAAGTDISQFRDFTSAERAIDYEATMDGVLVALESCPIPTIAAICGACTGGGAAIASACDLRIASADMKFGFPIARTLGNCLSAANLARLNALVGAGRVREMIFLSRLMDADEAMQTGLVTEVLESHGALMERARELAVRLAGQAPLTLRATKEIQRRLARVEVQDEDWIVRCYTSEDFREGLEAFLGKRQPVWKGR
jgi:enoyl-CoA hydratase/carnithine racemase